MRMWTRCVKPEEKPSPNMAQRIYLKQKAQNKNIKQYGTPWSMCSAAQHSTAQHNTRNQYECIYFSLTMYVCMVHV